MKFTLEEVLKVNGHKTAPRSVLLNLEDLIRRVNEIGYPAPARCSSGYRDPEYNKKIGGATKSAHCKGKAMDIADPDGKIKKYLMARESLLEELGLRMEAPASTPSWCHLDTMPVVNKRIFNP